MKRFLNGLGKYVFRKRLLPSVVKSAGLALAGSFLLVGCAPLLVTDVPSTALGITCGVSAILGLVYLVSYSMILAGDLLSPPLGQPRTKTGRWLRANGQELFFFFVILGVLLLFSTQGFAQVRIPGSDESAKLKAAGTLLMLVDTALFVWLARIFAGLCVLSAGWLIKEQKFGPAVVCVLGALIIGTSPLWVQNIFEIGGGGGVFK